MVAAVSWQVSTAVHRAEDIRSAVEHAQPSADMSDAQAEQMRELKKIAVAMLDNRICGDAGEDSELAFRVQLHGHVSSPGEGALPSATVIVEQMPASNVVDPPPNSGEDPEPDEG